MAVHKTGPVRGDRYQVLPPDVRAVRAGGAALLLHVRALVLVCLFSAAALAAGVVSLGMGDYPVPLGEVVLALAGGGDPISAHVVTEMRLPRVASGAGVGAAFALAGAVFQRVVRNPLVSPDVIGINAGASAGAVLAITVLGGSTLFTVAGALIGAFASAALCYLVAYQGGVSGYRLVLVGIGVTALSSALTSYLLTRAELHDAQRASIWLTGSLANRSWSHAGVIAGALLVSVPVAVILARRLRLLELGDDMARTLGIGPDGARSALLGSGVVLAALATAAAGPIAFVALVAPQIVRRLLNESTAGLAASAACGAMLTVAADLAARSLFAPIELPVGVLTAVAGAPFLLVLLARANRIGRSG